MTTLLRKETYVAHGQPGAGVPSMGLRRGTYEARQGAHKLPDLLLGIFAAEHRGVHLGADCVVSQLQELNVLVRGFPSLLVAHRRQS